MTELVLPGVAAVEANHGRWVGRCSYRDRCDAAVHLARFQQGFICGECGGRTDLVWPAESMVEGVERLLLMRPHRKNQNWLPGETLHDLLHQNAMHGILTQHAAGLDSGGLFGIENDRVTTDTLPTLNPRRELVP